MIIDPQNTSIFTPQHLASRLVSSRIETPVGAMLAISDDEFLYLLEFIDSRCLERKVKRLQIMAQQQIAPGMAKPISSIQCELRSYFSGVLSQFQTKKSSFGTQFQQQVWQAITTIPYAQTQSYLDQANWIGKPTAFRAVANANGANPLSIVVPCHRIIQTTGALGGYAGGIERKRWLLAHEQQMKGYMK